MAAVDVEPVNAARARGLRAAERVMAALVLGAARLVAQLPLRVGDELGARLGELGYWLLSSRRRIAEANLALAFGAALGPHERAALARANFRHLGMTAVECCRLFLGPPERMLSRVLLEGIEHIKAALADGRGAFYLSAHFGNWELTAAAHVLTGFPLNVIVRPLDNPLLESLVARGRERGAMRLIPKRAAVQGVQAALARNECVGILLDQNAGADGVFVPFFGCPASTSRSLAVLALKTGAPVVPAFSHRLPSGEHQLTLEPPVPLMRTGDLQHDVGVNTARFTAAIEKRVRIHPDQWFWVHRRWKTRPPAAT